MNEALVPTHASAEVDQLLKLHDLSGEAAVAYFSFEGPQSFIAARDASGVLAPLIGFWPLPVRGVDLLEAVASIDDSGPRLIDNYARGLPELIDVVRALGSELEPVESESLGWLLAACSLVVGMQEEDVARALCSVEALVQLDLAVLPRNDRYAVDSRRLLRSLMSYRIAAVPNHVLARSVFESLGEFAANAIRRLLRDWRVPVAVCAGDLFQRNRFIAERARKGLTRPGLQLCFPPSPEES
ncbi:MAG: hypothetical protein ACLP8S_24700 [Solirubrobacteraceae bacterium]